MIDTCHSNLVLFQAEYFLEAKLINIQRITVNQMTVSVGIAYQLYSTESGPIEHLDQVDRDK